MNDGPADPTKRPGQCGHLAMDTYYKSFAICELPPGHEHAHMQRRADTDLLYYTWSETNPRRGDIIQDATASMAFADINGLDREKKWSDRIDDTLDHWSGADWQIDDTELDQARDQWEADAA